MASDRIKISEEVEYDPIKTKAFFHASCKSTRKSPYPGLIYSYEGYCSDCLYKVPRKVYFIIRMIVFNRKRHAR